MIVSVNSQMLVFFACIMAGIASALIYDTFRAIRILFNPGKKVVFFMDLLFWLISSMILFSVVYITCGGELRWFEFLGLMLGMLFYFFAFSHIFLTILVGLVRAIINFTCKVLKIVFKPIYSIYMFVLSKTGCVKSYFQNKFNKILRFIKKTLENIKRIGIILKKA